MSENRKRRVAMNQELFNQVKSLYKVRSKKDLLEITGLSINAINVAIRKIQNCDDEDEILFENLYSIAGRKSLYKDSLHSEIRKSSMASITEYYQDPFSMHYAKWHDETLWSPNNSFDCNSLLNYKNVLLIHCPICPFLTFNYKRLLEHLTASNHSGTLECVFYQCNECQKISTSSLLIKEHFNEEHTHISNKHSNPLSCLGIQRFVSKTEPEDKIENNDEAQCLFCSYRGNDISHHYSTEHNIFTASTKFLKSGLRSILNIMTETESNPIVDYNDMKMSDGTLIIIPEEPQESVEQMKDEHLSDSVDNSNFLSKGSRKRKMCQPVSTNGTGTSYLDKSESSESNSENYNNQFVNHNDQSDINVCNDHSNIYDKISASFIDSHLNNIMVCDESSDHSSDTQKPLSGDLVSVGPGCAVGQHSSLRMGSKMMRKRGRPPKISSQTLSKEEIENELTPHIEIMGKSADNQDMVKIASGEPYSVVVSFQLLVNAFDLDGVQYLKNLIRLYYKPEQLSLFAWDVSQKRGRPRTSIITNIDPNKRGGSNLQSLRQQPFVQASMKLIECLFGQAFPANLPIFINRLLQSHRYCGSTSGTISALNVTKSLPNNSKVHGLKNNKKSIRPLSYFPVSQYRDAEQRLSRVWIPCLDSDKDVKLSCNSPRIRKNLLLCAYDNDPVRFFRNLIRSALPLEELLHNTMNGKNTDEPYYFNSTTGIQESNINLNCEKKSLIDHPLVQDFLEFVPKACGYPLPENFGPVIQQMLDAIRKTHYNNGININTGSDI